MSKSSKKMLNFTRNSNTMKKLTILSAVVMMFLSSADVIGQPLYRDGKTWFGVNYCAPFAHGYRVHNRLGKDAKEAISRDVYHIWRMGMNAYRIHVWDVEISDGDGNLIENEHLDLLDYTVAEMKKRGIDVTLTPIAFWGNGWPEPDDLSQPGFSNKKGKGEILLHEPSIKAMENYLKQFMKHKNRYTGNTYATEPAVVAIEVNNEPNEHALTDKQVTAYITRMVKAIKSSGFKKPVLYNISENVQKADATLRSNADGFTMQWYPLGLCSGEPRGENGLPLVAHYNIPFAADKRFANKLKWIYEFDSADMLGSYMYPAMARAFREAGFQWATQFAYDPFLEAPVNTDYNTHYLNLCFTPSKAVGMFIAGKVFADTKSLQKFPDFPQSNTFGYCSVDSRNDVTVYNSPTVFAYTRSIADRTVKPVCADSLALVAGVGSSSVVRYGGTGAYFLQKVADRLWLLEVYPDALLCDNPFTNHNSAERTVSVIQSHWLPITVALDALGDGFAYRPLVLNDGVEASAGKAEGRTFSVYPGRWLLGSGDISGADIQKLAEFKQCPSNVTDAKVVIRSPKTVEVGRSLSVEADIALPIQNAEGAVSQQNLSEVWLIGSVKGGRYFRLKMQKTVGNPYGYSVNIGNDILAEEGVIEYSVVLQTVDGKSVAYPSGIAKDPHQWDFSTRDVCRTEVVKSDSPAELYNALTDIGAFQMRWQKGCRFVYLHDALEIGIQDVADYKRPAGMLLQIADKLACRPRVFEAVQLRCERLSESITLQWQAYTADGGFYTAETELGAGAEQITVPFELFREEALKPMRDGYPTFAYAMPQLYGKPLISKDITSLVVCLKPQSDKASIAVKSISAVNPVK